MTYRPDSGASDLDAMPFTQRGLAAMIERIAGDLTQIDLTSMKAEYQRQSAFILLNVARQRYGSLRHAQRAFCTDWAGRPTHPPHGGDHAG